MANDLSGRTAEFLSLQYLRLKGYSLVRRNYITGRGTGAGEVDLIMQKNQTLVFVEVKKRNSLVTAAYAVRPRQQQRIRRAAEAFLAHHAQYRDFDIRFDAVLVEFPLKIRHIEDAF